MLNQKKHILIILCFLLCVAYSFCGGKKDYIQSVETFSDTAENDTVFAAEKYPYFYTKQKKNITPGFISGVLWLAVTFHPPESGEKLILDLGPEIMDRAELFAYDPSGKLVRIDGTGRLISARNRKVATWRSALFVPAGQNRVFVRISSTDSVHLALRAFVINDFYEQTSTMTFIHALILGMISVILVFLLAGTVFFREKLFFLLFLANLCFLLYQLSMKGLLHAYVPFISQSPLLATRLSYLACLSGLAIGLILFSQFISPGKKRDFISVSLQLIAIIVFSFSLLYLAVPHIRYVYNFSLYALIGSCFVICAVIVTILFIQKKISAGILTVWLPFLIYVIFRQSYHIARLSCSFPRLESLFNYDYYFGYDLCLLFQLVVYTWLICKRGLENQRSLLLERERFYFYKTMSHELRAPANVVNRAAGELIAKIKQDEELIGLAKTISGNVERIYETSELINSLEEQELHIERIADKLETVSPKDTLESIIDNFAWYANLHSKSLKSSIQIEGCVRVYSLFLKTIFSNLIDNAVKYGREDIPITMKLYRQNSLLCFSVCSCGTPINPAEVNSLFNLGRRLPEAEASGVSGLGLGLNLVYRIARLYNGTVKVHTEENTKGNSYNIFTVFLKLQFTEKVTETYSTNEIEPFTPDSEIYSGEQYEPLPDGKTILLVDDDLSVLQLLYEEFIPRYNVITAADGLDALEKMKTVVPDIIVCDVQMPRMNGIELKKHCASNTAYDAIPFLFLTADTYNSGTVKRAYAEGIVDYLRKPVSLTELRGKVAALLILCQKIRREKTAEIVALIQNAETLRQKNPGDHKKEAFEHRRSLYESYKLSPTEQRVCEIFSNGKNNREIAEIMCVSIDTVGTHLRKVYKKTAVKNRTELAILLSASQ